MAKFMFVYREAEPPTQEPSPEEMQQILQVWMEWIEKGTSEGWMVDGGDALAMDGKTVGPDMAITDGPFAESKELVSGYSLVEAADYDAATEYAKTCPMISVHKGYVEVRQLLDVGKPE